MKSAAILVLMVCLVPLGGAQAAGLPGGADRQGRCRSLHSA